jgi:large subunit ribosomal protein L6
LEIQGVGYRAQMKGQDLELQLGFSHPVNVKAPDGISFEVPQPTQIVVRGISKQRVGETAAQIRKWRPPEPYKGKGIRYADEYVQRKVGKRA